MKSADFSGRSIYHFTHLDNLASVVERGCLISDNLVQATGGCAEVGDQSLKAKRRQTAVPIGSGGVVADYVPFYFATRSPMLFRIATKQVEYQGGEGPLIFFETDIATAVHGSRDFVFSDGHPVAAYTEFFDNLEELPRIDWGVMGQRMWNPTQEDPDRMRRRQAEFLIRERFPLAAIRMVVARSDDIAAAAQQVVTTLGWGMKVETRAGWYYQK